MYDVELAGAPFDLDGRLVARMMPEPATATFETAVQRHLTRFEFPVPAIRCAAGPSLDLDRAWSLMDFAPGQPLLAGLSGPAPSGTPTDHDHHARLHKESNSPAPD